MIWCYWESWWCWQWHTYFYLSILIIIFFISKAENISVSMCNMWKRICSYCNLEMHLEFGVACWNCGLTGKLSDQIERIQKICVNIILCDSEWEIPYFVGCTLLGLEPLSFRRTDLCIRFAQKTSQDPRHTDLFVKNTNQYDTRQDMPIYRDFQCRTGRFFKSLYAIWLGSWISSFLKNMQRKLSEIYVMLIVDNKLSIVQPVLLLQELHWDELYFALPLYLK